MESLTLVVEGKGACLSATTANEHVDSITLNEAFLNLVRDAEVLLLIQRGQLAERQTSLPHSFYKSQPLLN